MNLEEKAKRESIGITISQRYIFRIGFESGYKECIFDVTEFIRVNPKASHQAIIEYMEGIA